VTVPMRLAIRSEGNMLNAYIAETGTMDRAILVGSIVRRACDDQPEIFEAWKELMKLVMTETVRTVFGVTPENWREDPAPESERSGSA
jgi:hypothetical protein